MKYFTTTCDKCRKSLKYNEKFDCYYCPKCNEWLEKKCSDKACCFCSKRPDKPKVTRLTRNLKEMGQDLKDLGLIK
jgi:hypothetical protein